MKPTIIHKEGVRASRKTYEARCGYVVPAVLATDDWTRVNCYRCLRQGAKRSSVVATLMKEVRDERTRNYPGPSADAV